MIACCESPSSSVTVHGHSATERFTSAFGGVYEADGVKIVQTPLHARNANVFAERWIRTAREDCLDWLLITGPDTSSVS